MGETSTQYPVPSTQEEEQCGVREGQELGGKPVSKFLSIEVSRYLWNNLHDRLPRRSPEDEDGSFRAE